MDSLTFKNCLVVHYYGMFTNSHISSVPIAKKRPRPLNRWKQHISSYLQTSNRPKHLL